MLNQLNTTTKRELDSRYLVNSDILQGSKEVTNTRGTIKIPDYGLTESIDLYFKPTQDLHGYDKPWVGGAGKNKLPLVLADIKSANTSGTWSGNTYSVNGVDYTINEDDAGNVISIGINGTSTGWENLNLVPPIRKTLDNFGLIVGNSYIFTNGLSSDVYGLELFMNGSNSNIQATASGTTFVVNAVDEYYYSIRVRPNNTMNNVTLYPMIRLSTETDTDFEPYTNICPIIGQDKATLTWNNNQGISMNFGTTYYGGIANFDGTINSDWQRIASYNGETLSGEWLSDRDEYVQGTTPTTGAEVVYKTTPTHVRVAQPDNLNLTDDYPIEYNGYKVTIKYQPKDTILEDAKSYTNQQIEKLGLPQPPISNGNYQLVCTVSSGTPTLSWETIQ